MEVVSRNAGQTVLGVFTLVSVVRGKVPRGKRLWGLGINGQAAGRLCEWFMGAVWRQHDTVQSEDDNLVLCTVKATARVTCARVHSH